MNEIAVTVHVPSELSRDLSRLTRGMRRTVTKGAAMGIEAALRDHFQELQGRPRKDGGKGKSDNRSGSGNNRGVAQAKAVLFFILVAAIGLIQLRATRKKEVQQ